MNVSSQGQIRLVIVSATGMVGGYALGHALHHPSVAVVTAINRRVPGISHPKLNEGLRLDSQTARLRQPLSAQDVTHSAEAWGSTPRPEFSGRISRPKGSKPNGRDAASGSGRRL